MATAADLVEVLKGELRARAITYAQLAGQLELSEASVKRMFALRRMSVERLDAICMILALQVSDLVHRFEQLRHRVSRLSAAQEREIVEDMALLLVAVSVKNHWTFAELLHNYTLTAAEIIQKLAHLDRFKLIELLPGNRIRLLFDADFRWIPGGPIETYFENVLVSEFLNNDFHGAGRTLRFVNGWVTAAVGISMLEKMDALADEFNAGLARSSTYPVDQRVHVGMLVAFRPCGFSDFRALVRSPTQQQANTPST